MFEGGSFCLKKLSKKVLPSVTICARSSKLGVPNRGMLGLQGTVPHSPSDSSLISPDTLYAKAVMQWENNGQWTQEIVDGGQGGCNGLMS